MNIEQSGLIDLIGTNGPLCPRSMPPQPDRAHTTAARVADAVWAATPRDGNDDAATPELDALSDVASNDPQIRNEMLLYRDTVEAASSAFARVEVEALYFKCRVCGFVLPALRTSN